MLVKFPFLQEFSGMLKSLYNWIESQELLFCQDWSEKPSRSIFFIIKDRNKEEYSSSHIVIIALYNY